MTAQTVAAAPDPVLEFAIGTEHYCVDSGAVAAVVSPREMRALPDAPPAVPGVMPLDGEATTIVNPALLFDADATGDGQRVVVFEGSQRFGWLVDSVHGVREVPSPVLEPIADTRYVNGLVDDSERPAVWVDARRINSSLPVSATHE